jgi:hypothetical protein
MENVEMVILERDGEVRVEDVVVVISLIGDDESGYKVVSDVVLGSVVGISNEMRENRLELDSEDLEFFSFYKINKEFGIKEGRVVGMNDNLSCLIFRVKDIIDLEELNKSILGGEGKISWEEINKKVKEL